MASLNDWLSRSTETIELGEIKQIEGNNTYIVLVSGMERRAYSTLKFTLAAGSKVIINKLSSGKRFITNETGLAGNSLISQEVYIDG